MDKLAFEKRLIGNLCCISSSKRIFAYEYQLSGIPFYRSKEIIEKQNNNKVSSNLYISKEKYEAIKNKFGVPQKGDLLLTSVGTLGVPYIVKDEVFYFKDGNLTWFYDFHEIISEYLYYWFLSPIGKHSIETKCIGSTQKALTIDTLRKFEIYVPSMEQQLKIVSILKSLDDKIELNRRINENLEQQAQALFKSWFIDSTNIELNYHELGNITSITAGGDKPSIYSKELTEKCYIPIYSNGIENEGLYGYTDLAKINSSSITISARGTIGYICLRTRPYVPIVRLISVIPNIEGLSAEYLYLWALTQNFSATGTTQQQLTVPNLKKIPIGIPTKEILEKFNSIVIPIFQLIEKNKDENMKLAHLRDTLLPKLISGELKLSEIETKLNE